MAKIIGLVNQKGGVAKTTTASALAFGLAEEHGKRILLIDFDPQGNLTESTGIDVENWKSKKDESGKEKKMETFYWLMRDVPFNDVVLNVPGTKVDILPTGIILAGAEKELNSERVPHSKLRKAIDKIEKDYDYIIIDSSPNLANLTINVLCAVQEVIVPFKPEPLSLQILESLIDTVNEIKKEQMNSSLIIRGFLPTICRSNTISTKEVIEIFKRAAEEEGTKVYNAKIRQSVDASDAPANAHSLFAYKKNSKVAQDYRFFIQEFLKEEKK